MNRIRIVIPSRYESSRFPGKALALVGGVPMVQRVWERAGLCVPTTDVFVSTDDSRIASAIQKVGGNVVLTSPNIENGTARCAWSAHVIGTRPDDIIVNVQGDQPLVDRGHVLRLAAYMVQHPEVDVATAVTHLSPSHPQQKGDVYAVLDTNGDALYFSRSLVPFPHSDVRDDLHKHIGLYAYRVRALSEYINWVPGAAEQAEGLEQLRWLEHGYKVRCVHVNGPVAPEVNYPEDVQLVEAWVDRHGW